jgi:predicted tellurium resistance membrane protein TerC
VRSGESLGTAIRTIILADVVMSLDNILAVGGTAEGHLALLLFGLGLSIPLLLLGSNLVARLLQTMPWLLVVGVTVLLHASIKMFLHDHYIEELIRFRAPEWVIVAASPLVAFLLFAAVRLVRGSVNGIGERAT